MLNRLATILWIVLVPAVGIAQTSNRPALWKTSSSWSVQDQQNSTYQDPTQQSSPGQGDFFQEGQRTPSDFIWENETLPDYLEEIGLEEYSGQPTPSAPATAGQPFRAPQPTPEQAKAAALTRMFGSSCDPVWCRPTLTGDWYGRRIQLAKKGVVYRGRVTQYFFSNEGGSQQSVALGGLEFTEGGDFQYTGNSQHDFLFDLEQLGGPKAGKFVLTLENLWGEFGNVWLSSGTSTPTHFNALQPFDPAANGAIRMTNFMLVQPVSERLIITAGKTRLVGTADRNVFAGGDGSDQFINQTFVANPLFLDTLVISSFAVGAVMPRDWGNMAIRVIDPQERSTDFFDMGDLFSKGMIVLGQARFNTNFFNKPGEHHIGGIYKNVDLLDLRFTPTLPTYPYPPAPPGFATKSDTYTLFYGFDQYIGVYGPADQKGETRGWGLFGRAGLSDSGTGNPAINGWHASVGVGGDSPLYSRRHTEDRFGIGYGFTATSTEWGDTPRNLLAPRDSQVLESYYRYHLTPAISITPDLQWIRGNLSGLSGGDDTWVYGIRMNIKL